MGSLKDQEVSCWTCNLPGNSKNLGFAMAYRLDKIQDLTSIAKSLPEGVVISTPLVVAGFDHIQSVLMQVSRYWQRDQALARNKSIDLLMRITCQRQISEAVRVSRISATDVVALFGLADSGEQIETSRLILEKLAGIERDDNLILLDDRKESYLKEYYSFPSWFSKDQIVVALKEKSLLLIFSR